MSVDIAADPVAEVILDTAAAADLVDIPLLPTDAASVAAAINDISAAGVDNIPSSTTDAVPVAAAINDVEAVVLAAADPIHYTDKTCINIECKPPPGQTFVVVSQFVLSHYYVRPLKTTRTAEPLFVCTDCNEAAIDEYHRLASCLNAKQSLVQQKLRAPPSLVEILDSSDEDEADGDHRPTAAVQRSGTLASVSAAMPDAVLAMLASELESTLSSTFQRVNLKQQTEWAMNDVVQKMTRCQEEMDANRSVLTQLQRSADRMHRNLYSTELPGLRNLPPVDADVPSVTVTVTDSPTLGQVGGPTVRLNERYYAVRRNILSPWPTCIVVEVVSVAMFGKWKQDATQSKLNKSIKNRLASSSKFSKNVREILLMSKMLEFLSIYIHYI